MSSRLAMVGTSLGRVVLVGLIVGWSTPVWANAGEVKRIGSFTNASSDGQHEAGFTVNLWMHEGRPVGILTYHIGLVGDSPRGILEDVKFAPASGDLAFRVKLSLGQVVRPGKGLIPSRDVLVFTGRLEDDAVSGVFVESSFSEPKPGVVGRYDVKLSRDDSATWVKASYENYAAWRSAHEKQLKAFGPKW